MLKRQFVKSLFGSALLLLGCHPYQGSHERVGTEEFAQLIADTTVVRLDVRTHEEYVEGHIQGAVNIDMLNKDFLHKAISILPRQQTIALYCASGKRSHKAAKMLSKRGYRVIELKCGYKGWRKANR
ncbi:MAG: rhodanese-like domain-containing protein [Bacteroidaceae bacterium]